METDLFKHQHKNILTYVTYFNSIGEKAENYYLFVQNYKKYTSEYFDKISSLFKAYSTIFGNTNNNNNSNNADLSPLDKLTKDLYKDFKEQLHVFNFFLKNIELSLDNFRGIMNQTKLDVENQKNIYVNYKNKFIESFSLHKKDNEDLINGLSNVEKKIIKFYFLTKKVKNDSNKNSKNKNNNKNKIEEEINKEIKRLKNKEDSFLQKDSIKLKTFVDYNKSIEDYKANIKNNIFLLLKIFKLSIDSFSKYFKNLFNYSEKNPANKEEKKTNKKEIFHDYESIINKNLIKINHDTIKSSMEQTKPKHYTIKVLENKQNAIIQEICDALQKEGYEIDSNIVLDQKDISYVTNKLNNFSLLNKDNSVSEKGNKKKIISDIIEKMFSKVDNSQKSLEEESQKLSKYLEKNKNHCKNFLSILENKKNSSNVVLSSELFDIFTKMFSLILDMIVKEKDFDTQKNLLTLSQTFYKSEEDKKIFLINNLKSHELFQKEENWINYIKHVISAEIDEKINDKNKNQNEIDKDDINKRKNEIILSQMTNIVKTMKNLEINNEKLLNIINSLLEFYTMLTPDTKEQIMKLTQV